MLNICKFPQTTFQAPLTTACFVMETNEDTMRTPAKLITNRMLLVIQGQGIIKFDERSLNYKTGQLIFGFEGETTYIEPQQETVYMYINFAGMRSQELFDRFNINTSLRVVEKCDSLIPLWRESLSRAQNLTIDLAAESILLYSFSRLTSRNSEQSNLIGKILKLTEENFSDPETSISKIAEALSYNPKYLSHVFKNAMNVTFSEYLRDMRIKFAVSLFNEGLDSVKNVALISGFSDPLYFSNIFKKTMGMSPREYIASISAGVEKKS